MTEVDGVFGIRLLWLAVGHSCRAIVESSYRTSVEKKGA